MKIKKCAGTVKIDSVNRRRVYVSQHEKKRIEAYACAKRSVSIENGGFM